MEKNYLKDISEIRSIMERSSRFISLSGLSGVLAGIYALVAAALAYQLAYENLDLGYETIVIRNIQGNTAALIAIAIGTLLLAIITGAYLTKRKAHREGVKSWDSTAKKLVVNLLIPLITGGILVVIFYSHGLIPLIAPTTLIFYGLGLINASHYTYRDIRYLGISEVVLGLIASLVIGYGLLIWAIGFGVLHIIYGALMHFKYDR